MKHRSTGASSIRKTALVLVILGWLAAPVCAHPSPFSYLDLRINQGELVVVLSAHTLDFAHDLNVEQADALLSPLFIETKKTEILNLLRSRFALTADGLSIDLELLRIEPQPDRQALALHLRFQSTSMPGVIGIRCALFPYDPQHQTFLNIYESGALTHQEIFDKDRTTIEYFTGSRQGAAAVVKKFISAGIQHIFIGPDHILFIVGLLLLGGSLLRLLTIVTAFTLAHSLTLSLAALDLLSPPPSLIEPVIALSIVYVGIDNLMWKKGDRDVRAWIAFSFGFIHGFGFAGVLKEFGLPSQSLGWSLFAFNVGVEIGQVCIVVVVAVLLAALRKRNEVAGRRVMILGSVVVILAGSYWFIQRVFF